MNTPKTPTPDTAASNELDERIVLANELYREFHTQCFWHSSHDLMITEDLLPFVIKGLRTHGGRRGFLLAEALRPKLGPDPESARRSSECR